MGTLKRWGALLLSLVLVSVSAAQSTYQPKFPRDPARSDSEAMALGYMRTVMAAEREYKKKHAYYAASLPALVGSGSFTRRMINPQRGEYTVSFQGSKTAYSLAFTPARIDADHRAFYVDERNTIRVEEDKPATKDSPPLKSQR